MKKTPELIKAMAVKETTVSGTTNTDGALSLESSVPLDAEVLSIRTTSDANAMCIPFVYNKTRWYAKIVDWRTLTKMSSKAVTLTIRFIGGGYGLTSILSRLAERWWKYEDSTGTAGRNNRTAQVFRTVLRMGEHIFELHESKAKRECCYGQRIFSRRRDKSACEYIQRHNDIAGEIQTIGNDLLYSERSGRIGADNRRSTNKWSDKNVLLTGDIILVVHNKLCCRVTAASEGRCAA